MSQIGIWIELDLWKYLYYINFYAYLYFKFKIRFKIIFGRIIFSLKKCLKIQAVNNKNYQLKSKWIGNSIKSSIKIVHIFSSNYDAASSLRILKHELPGLGNSKKLLTFNLNYRQMNVMKIVSL